MNVHPAAPEERAELEWFARSGRSISEAVRDPGDVLANWSILGVHPRGDGHRVYLFERSRNAVACVDGDGETFGEVGAPTSPREWAEFLARHDIRV